MQLFDKFEEFIRGMLIRKKIVYRGSSGKGTLSVGGQADCQGGDVVAAAGGFGEGEEAVRGGVVGLYRIVGDEVTKAVGAEEIGVASYRLQFGDVGDEFAGVVAHEIIYQIRWHFGIAGALTLGMVYGYLLQDPVADAVASAVAYIYQIYLIRREEQRDKCRAHLGEILAQTRGVENAPKERHTISDATSPPLYPPMPSATAKATQSSATSISPSQDPSRNSFPAT